MHLEVLMWIEIGIKDDNGVRSCQVNADTPSPRTQDVDEDVRARLVKLIHILLTIDLWGRTVLRITISNAISR